MCFFVSALNHINPIVKAPDLRFLDADTATRTDFAKRWRSETLLSHTYKPAFEDWYKHMVEPFNGRIDAALRSFLRATNADVGPELFECLAYLINCNIFIIMTSLSEGADGSVHLAVRCASSWQPARQTGIWYFREMAGAGHFESCEVDNLRLLPAGHEFITFLRQQPFFAEVKPIFQHPAFAINCLRSPLSYHPCDCHPAVLTSVSYCRRFWLMEAAQVATEATSQFSWCFRANLVSCSLLSFFPT